MSSRCLVVTLLSLLIMAFCQGCGGQSGSEANLVKQNETPTEVAPEYPLPSADGLLSGANLEQPGLVVKARSEAPQTVVPGTAINHSVGTVVSPVGNGAVRLAAVPGEDVSWAMYRVGGLNGDRPVSLLVDASPVEGSDGEYYVAFGNYSNFSWDWHGPFTEPAEIELNSAEFRARVIDAGYTMSVIVLQHSAELPAGAAVDLASITVDQLAAGSAQYYGTRPIFTPLDAIWVGDAPGSKGTRDLLPAQYVTLTWTHEDDLLSTCAILQYQIWRWDIFSLLTEDPIHIGTVLAPEETYVDPLDNASTAPELIPGHAYIYFLKSWNNAGEARWSYLDAVIIPELADYNLYASDAVYYNSISLTWDAISNAVSYEIWADDDTTPLATVSAGDVAVPGEPGHCRWDHTGLGSSEEHTYRVRALTSSSSLNFSNSDVGSTKPGEVYELITTDGMYYDHVTAEWNAIENASQYELWLDDDTEPLVTVDAGDVVHPSNPGHCQWDHTGLAPGESHTYRVRALLPVGAANFSNSDQGSTHAGFVYLLSASDSLAFHVIELVWNQVENATQYEIWLDSDTEPYATVNAADVAHPTEAGRCRWEHTGLDYAEVHTYRVRALFTAGTANFSNSDQGNTRPEVVYNLQASDGASTDSITLDWYEAIDAMNYGIFVDGGTTAYTTITAANAANPAAPGSCQWHHTGLAPGTTHTYQVQAELPIGLANMSNSDEGSTSPMNEYIHTAGFIDTDLAYDVAVNQFGEAFVVGYTRSFGVGGSEQLVQKYNADGLLAWSRTYGTTYDSHFIRGRCDANGDLITIGTGYGFSAGDEQLQLYKYDRAGNIVWKHSIGHGGNEYYYGLELDASGNIFVTGYVVLPMIAGQLYKFDSSGILQWNVRYGRGSQHDEVMLGLHVDQAGNIYVAARTKAWDMNSYLLLKYTSAGTLVWCTKWDGTDNDTVAVLDVDSVGNVYLAGWTTSPDNGDRDVLVVKFASDSSFIWAKTWGGTGDDTCNEAMFGHDGQLYLVGATKSFGGVSSDGFILRMTTDGVYNSAYRYDTLGSSDALFGLDFDANGALYVAGTAENANIELIPITNAVTTQLAGTISGLPDTYVSPGTINSYTAYGTQTQPAFIMDTGGGGADALIMKINPNTL